MAPIIAAMSATQMRLAGFIILASARAAAGHGQQLQQQQQQQGGDWKGALSLPVAEDAQRGWDGHSKLMRRESGQDQTHVWGGEEDVDQDAPSEAAASLEGLTQASMTRIVYDSLQATKFNPQVSTQFQRKAPVPRDLRQVCLLTNPQSDPTAFLASKPWHDQVREGKRLAHGKRIIFAGLWREIGASAASEIFNVLMALGSFFRDYQLIMLENDSKDDTVVGITRSCASVERAWCFTLSGIGKQVLHAGAANRIMGLTALRQTLLMKVLEFDHAGVFDYVMMIDADIYAQGNGGFDIGGALAAFTLPQRMQADGVCAMQVSGRSQNYYDTFAHRGAECKYADLDKSAACPAESCGGGMVFYSLPSIRESKCNYTYVNEQTCEHIPFNQCLAQHNSGRIYIFKPWAVAMASNKGERSDWSCTLL